LIDGVPLIDVVPSVGAGLGTGTDGLMPAPPSSVAPNGIPTRPIVDGEDRVDGAVALLAHAVDEVPASPPPSNNAPGEAEFADVGQFVMSCPGLSGEVPGVAISVDPSGIPTGRVDCVLSGDVGSMPGEVCIPGIAVWAIAAADTSQRPAASSMHGRIASRCDPDLLMPVWFVECWSRMDDRSAMNVAGP
jgi:hypothetical protein